MLAKLLEGVTAALGIVTAALFAAFVLSQALIRMGVIAQ